MKNRELVQRLAALELFSGCSDKDLETIASLGTEQSIVAGEQIVRQGSMGYDCFVVLAGDVVVSRNDRMVATVGVGEFVGELTVLDHQPRSATVVAVSNVDLLVLSHRELRSVLSKVPVVAERLVAMMAARSESAADPVGARMAVAGSRLASR